MKLFVRTLGNDASPSLIILHGLFGSSDNWLSIAKIFAEKYKVYLLDARNHGQSPWSDVHSYESMAADLEMFIKDNNIINPYIIGHSMGGKTLMRFAVTTKISIKKIVVVDIAPKYYEPHHQREIAALKGINLSTLTSRQEADDIMAKTIPELMVRQFLMKGLYRAESGSFHWRFNLDVIASQIENIGEAQNIELASKTPTLFIKGEKSNYYINESDTDLIKKLFPNSNIIIIPNAGHWVQAEQPQLFYEAVESFFA